MVEPAALAVARGDAAVEELVATLSDVYAAAATLTTARLVLRFLEAFGYRRGLHVPERSKLTPQATRAATTTMSERPPKQAAIPLDELANVGHPALVVSGRWNTLAAGEQALGRRAFGAVAESLTLALGARRVLIGGCAHGCQYSGKPFSALQSFWEAATRARR